MLNRTASIDTIINTRYINMFFCIKGNFLLLLKCKTPSKYSKKFKANNSTKSQLHQPPQDNSCSAHQHPKINDSDIKTTLE